MSRGQQEEGPGLVMANRPGFPRLCPVSHQGPEE